MKNKKTGDTMRVSRRASWGHFRPFLLYVSNRSDHVTAMRVSYVLHNLGSTPIQFVLMHYIHNPVALDLVFKFVKETPGCLCNHRDVARESVLLGLTDTVRVLYSHSHVLTPIEAERMLPAASADMALLLVDGILQANRYSCRRKVSLGVIQNVVSRGLTECVSVIIEKSDSIKDHLSLVDYAVAYARVDYLQQVLDKGLANVNNTKHDFYAAIEKGHFSIIEEFLRRGGVYSYSTCISHAQRCPGRTTRGDLYRFFRKLQPISK